MLGLVAALSLNVPTFGPLPAITRDPQVIYLDRSGAVIGVRGGRFPPPVNIASLPPYVPAAFVAIEDRRFYSHAGFDPMGIARAIVTDLGTGHAAQGGSTITQQLAKNLFLSSNRTLERKGEEIVLATQLERAYSKNQILGLYLSRMYFGSGAYGIEAASQRFFNKSATHLTLREAAMLAGVMKAPTNYNPAEQPENSAARTALVLDAMVETGAITPAQRVKALASRPKVWKSAANGPAQYFVDWLDAQTKAKIGAPRQDLIVDTTLDLPAETVAGAALSAGVARVRGAQEPQAALVSLDGFGRVRAFVGGTDYVKSPYDRAIDAHRQAGSAWKPFVYLTALEAGRTPDMIVVDEPVTINGWSPANFEPGNRGAITLETALAESVNTVAARLADEVGRPKVAATAQRLGITTTINTDPAMALGTSLVTPIDMATAYDAFSNGGYRVSAYGMERIRTFSGQVLYQHGAPSVIPAIANPPLSELDRMMRTVVTSGTGVRARIPGYDIAGKTGTTSDYKDAWFCGFTGGLTTVVWLGHDDGAPLPRIVGGSVPAEMWRGYMTAAVKRLHVQAIPFGPPMTAVPPPPVTPLPGGQPPMVAPATPDGNTTAPEPPMTEPPML